MDVFVLGKRMDDERHRLKPEIRQLVILSLLADAEGPVPAQQLKDTLFDSYPERPDSAHKRFSDDLRGLRDAGLVQYDSLRSPVTLVRWAKEPGLHLTGREHEALQEARDIAGTRAPGVSRVPGGATEQLAVVAALLRHLEEAIDVEVSELGDRIGHRPTRVRKLLERLQKMQAEYGDVTDPIDGLNVLNNPKTGLAASATLIDAGDAPRRRSTGNPRIGMEVFGLFAYNSAEANDRLELIELALRSGVHSDPKSLLSARDKLQTWQQRLSGLEGVTV